MICEILKEASVQTYMPTCTQICFFKQSSYFYLILRLYCYLCCSIFFHYAQNTKLIYKYTGNGRKFLLPVIGYISNIMILCCMMIAHVINWCYVHFGMIFNNSVICFLIVLVSCIHFIFYYYIYHVLALFDSIVNREKISQNLPVYVQMYY